MDRAVYKILLKLQKTLGPASHVHTLNDIPQLKCLVQEAAETLRNLPFSIPEDIRRDLSIATKGILTQKQPKPATKPALVWVEPYLEYM